MSKFTKQEDRDQAIRDLMLVVRRNTQESRCIDTFERLLNEISDKEMVDSVIYDMNRFMVEFFRLCNDVTNLKNIDYVAKMISYEFIRPAQYFNSSRKLAQLYLMLGDVLTGKYNHPVYECDKKIVLPGENRLGDIYHSIGFDSHEVAKITNKFGNLDNLSIDEVKEKYELARRVILLYNYLPAVVKAFVQTKRRSLDLDKGSKKFI